MSPSSLEASGTANGPEVPMPAASRYAGQPADASSRRSLRLVAASRDDAELPHLDFAEATHATVDFFYHEGRFWRAVVPLDGVEQVLGQAFNFSRPRTRRGPQGPEIVFDKHGLPKRWIPCLFHVQCRSRMKAEHPVRLHPLGETVRGEPAHLLHDFVYSVEAVGPTGVKFNLRDGLSGNLLSAHRFMSTREMVFERIVMENQYVTQSPPLDLTEQQKRALLIASLRRSDRAGMSETYHLIRFWGTNNCTSNPLQLLDEVVAYRGACRLGALLYRLPLHPRLYLRLRGLDPAPGVRRLVREEFAEYIAEEETQRRKKEVVRQLAAARRASRPAAEVR